MKVEVDVGLLDEALHYLSLLQLQSSDLTVVREKLSEAINEAEQRAAEERVRTALDDVANELMALEGPRNSVSLDEGERALRQIHDIAAGVLGKGEVLDRGDVRTSKNDLGEFTQTLLYHLGMASTYLTRMLNGGGDDSTADSAHHHIDFLLRKVIEIRRDLRAPEKDGADQ